MLRATCTTATASGAPRSSACDELCAHGRQRRRTRVQARLGAKAARDEADAEAAKAAREAAEEAEIAAEQEELAVCATRLETYRSSRRLYKADENGERVYTDAANRPQAVALKSKSPNSVTRPASERRGLAGATMPAVRDGARA